jgi:tetratricopeptide (TPR) repeat protein
MIRLGPTVVASALFAAIALNPAAAPAQEASHPPTLKLPGMPPMPLPPRGSATPRPGDDEEPGQALRAPPQSPPSDSDEKPHEKPEPPKTRAEVLDDLYARLAASKDVDETSGLVAAIDRLELASGSDAGDLIMARAMAAMGEKNYEVAGSLLDKLIDLDPQWAEAWNKRATLRFILDDDEGSMADIAHVLKIEPRHFGALSGMGMIFERQGFRDDALKAYRRALAIAPQLPSIKNSVDRMTKAVEGQDL